jgi:hypothetical protein
MKKMLAVILGILSTSCFALDDLPLQNAVFPPHDSSGFNQSMTRIQANFNEMYRALPLDQQNKVQCAAMSMENIRLKPPLEALSIMNTESGYAEQSMKTSVSQMTATDAVKAQIENARHEINQRMSEKILDLKARRTSRR